MRQFCVYGLILVSSSKVGAICEATIQVLLSHGADRLTTTRVADRAGVSVGTLYQYYPNKQSLLFAVFEDHMDKVTQAVEAACADALAQANTGNDQASRGSVCRRQDEPRGHFRSPLQSSAGPGWPSIAEANWTTLAEGDRVDAFDCFGPAAAARQIRHRHDALSNVRSDAVRA